MGNCLFTKLTGTVNNTSIPKIGKMYIGITKVSSPTQWTQGFMFSFNKNTTINIIGDGYFTDKTLTQNLGKSLKIKANVQTIVEVSNSNCEIEIDKYSLVYLNDYGDNPFVNTNVKNKKINDVASFQYSTALTALWLSHTQISGDVSKLSTLTALTSLSLSSTQISGDVSKLSTLTALTSLSLSNTQISGDVSKLSTLTALTSLSLSNTQTPLTGNISFLNGMSQLKECSLQYCKLTGDLATISSLIRFISFKYDKGSTFTWSSRPVSANIIALEGNVTCTNIDTMLINQAQCVKAISDSDAAWYKIISLSGTRTSASDAAVQTLQSKGYTVSVTPV